MNVKVATLSRMISERNHIREVKTKPCYSEIAALCKHRHVPRVKAIDQWGSFPTSPQSSHRIMDLVANGAHKARKRRSGAWQPCCESVVAGAVVLHSTDVSRRRAHRIQKYKILEWLARHLSQSCVLRIASTGRAGGEMCVVNGRSDLLIVEMHFCRTLLVAFELI